MANGSRIDPMTLKTVYQNLFDPNFDVADGMFSMVNLAEYLYRNYQKDEFTTKFVYMVLFRLYKDYPHVFAISVGQFPDFDDIEDYWKEHGFYDNHGYLWLVQRY